MTNSRIGALEDFAFARLARLLDDVTPTEAGLDLSIGDPKGAPPPWLIDRIAEAAGTFRGYPPPAGTHELRTAIAHWLARRFTVSLDPDREILPVAGTKEALHLVASVVVDPWDRPERPAVLLPNPLYQVYLGAAVLAGGEPVPLPATVATGFLPDLEAIAPALLDRCQLFYLCSPTNPQGTVADLAYWQRALDLARRHDFVLVADECYSEIWHTTPPPSALQVAAASGGMDRLLVFNSLSKRSNAAGLRVGFMAGDAALIADTLKVRRYGGATIPMPLQHAAVALFDDDAHVAAIRGDYTAKLDDAIATLGDRFGAYRPGGGFFLWLDVGDGERAARHLYREAGIRVIPGRFLSAAVAGASPGDRFIRLALVHDRTATRDAVAAAAHHLDRPF